MSEVRTALIKAAVVTQVVIASADYEPPKGVKAVASDTANVGDHWDGAHFTAPDPAPLTATQLVAYAEAKALVIEHSGLTINVAAADAPPKNIAVDTSDRGQKYVNGAVALCLLNPTQTFGWLQDGVQIQLSTDEMKAIGAAVGVFGQRIWDALTLVQNKIASGEITTPAQIDAYPWPVE